MLKQEQVGHTCHCPPHRQDTLTTPTVSTRNTQHLQHMLCNTGGTHKRVIHAHTTHLCNTVYVRATHTQAASEGLRCALPVSSQQGTALRRLWRMRTLLPQATTLNNESTLQPTWSAYSVPAVMLGASSASNEENRSVSSFKTQLPLNLLKGGLPPEPARGP